MSQSKVTLARRVAFSSGHRYWLANLTESQNQDTFGEWASPYNHGHNYVLWVECQGDVDEQNGMAVNIKWIDDVLQERVVRRFDQKSINDQVPEFSERSPSVENLLLHFSQALGELPGGVTLVKLKLEETPLLYGEWESPSMITLTRTYEFAAAHRLHVPSLLHEENLRLYGKCNHIHGHGHNYVLEVTVTGTPDPLTGMICDIGALDRVVDDQILGRYDHRNLDLDVPELSGKPSTSENVARAIFDRLQSETPAKLHRIRLFETARNMFEVTAG